MGQQWHYSRNGQKHGPFSGAELKELAASGRLKPEDMLWKQGMEKWVAASKVKGLFPVRQSQLISPSPAAATYREWLDDIPGDGSPTGEDKGLFPEGQSKSSSQPLVQAVASLGTPRGSTPTGQPNNTSNNEDTQPHGPLPSLTTAPVEGGSLSALGNGKHHVGQPSIGDRLRQAKEQVAREKFANLKRTLNKQIEGFQLKEAYRTARHILNLAPKDEEAIAFKTHLEREAPNSVPDDRIKFVEENYGEKKVGVLCECGNKSSFPWGQIGQEVECERCAKRFVLPQPTSTDRYEQILTTPTPPPTKTEEEVIKCLSTEAAPAKKLSFAERVKSAQERTAREQADYAVRAVSQQSEAKAAHIQELRARLAASVERLNLSSAHQIASELLRFCPGDIEALEATRFIEKDHANLVRPFIGHRNLVTSIAFSPNSKLLASGCADGPVLLWDVQTGKQLRQFKNQMGSQTAEVSLNSVAFSPDGRWVVAGMGTYQKRTNLFGKHVMKPYNCTVRFWDVQNGKEVQFYQGFGMPVESLAFSPSQRYLLTGSDTICLFDLADNKVVRRVQAGDGVKAVAFSPYGDTYMSSCIGANDDSTMQLWSLRTGDRLLHLSLGDGMMCPGWQIGYLADGRHALTLSQDSAVNLWSLETGKIIQHIQLDENEDSIVGIAVSPKGIAALALKASIVVWDLKAWQQVCRYAVDDQDLQGPKASGFVRSLAFSSDGKILASGMPNGSIRLWTAPV